MLEFSQNDSQWSGKLLGFSTVTIGKEGCVITAMGCMSGKNPSAVNDILKQEKAFDEDEVIWAKACAALGLEYEGSGSTPKGYSCIAETNHFKPNYPSHYFVMLSPTLIIDPLDGKTKILPYNIINYQYVHPKGNSGMQLLNIFALPDSPKIYGTVYFDTWDEVNAMGKTQADLHHPGDVKLIQKTGTPEVYSLQYIDSFDLTAPFNPGAVQEVDEIPGS